MVLKTTQAHIAGRKFRTTARKGGMMINDEAVIRDLQQFIELWSKTYDTEGKPDWSHILPYYDEDILFRDSVQEVRGLEEFRRMTERLTARSSELEMKIMSAAMINRTILMDWEMTILFRKTRRSVVYGASRLTLNEKGKICEQRDYYDLWGDILDNIPGLGKLYRKFMRKVFG
ncbi:MAG: SnoaL-like domain protein [Chloroflexi bacterium ADurb.Bin360]|nr:MAG: SnoaL-like domain protein [Chloroflexi bacterium ADurb.Bin360]